ncbi:Imm10 family immunity protein [Spirillospora sp. NPDC047418]
MVSDEYYVLNALKVRFSDGAAVCAAAAAELAALRVEHAEEFELQRYFTARTDVPANALIWLTSPTRLKYLYGGLDVEAEGQFFAQGDHLGPVPPAEDPLGAFWSKVRWQLDDPEPASDTPTMRLASAVEDAEAGTFVIGLAEHPDGTGQALLFMCRAAPESESRRDAETYCLSTDSGAVHYGGVRECVLEGRTLRLRLTRAAARDLEIGPDLTIALEFEDGALDELRGGLRRVLTTGPRRDRPKKLEV